MFDCVQDEIDSAVDHYKRVMPERIRALAGLASYDLWHGPVFYDPVTLEETDEEGQPFPFVSACDEIRDWLEESVSDVSIESFYDEESDTSQYETVDGSRKAIVKRLFGRLTEYL
jgi:hypothetical protein